MTALEKTRVRRRRRLSEAELGAWRLFLRAHATLLRGMEHDLEQARAVPFSFYGVLFTLASGPPEGMRLTELAERVFLTKSGLTRLLDRMAEHGLIERRSCAEDKRGQYAMLTPAGKRAFRRSAPAHLASIARRFADQLSPRELVAVAEALERVAEANAAAPAEEH